MDTHHQGWMDASVECMAGIASSTPKLKGAAMSPPNDRVTSLGLIDAQYSTGKLGAMMCTYCGTPNKIRKCTQMSVHQQTRAWKTAPGAVDAVVQAPQQASQAHLWWWLCLENVGVTDRGANKR